MAIITISRQIGSLGNEIAKSAAEKLGYEHIEKSQISDVLLKYGFPASEVDKYDEKRPSLWQTLSTQKNIFRYLIKAAVYDLTAKGNVVILGRGAQVILKDIPQALHVRVIAPYAVRLNRVMEQLGCEEKHARRTIHQNDRDSSGYISTYFDADWDDNHLYDLVINTRTLSMNNGVEMITQAVGADEIKKGLQADEKLIDLALTHRGMAVLLDVDGVEITNLDVKKGVAFLSGLTRSLEAKEECEHAVLNIKGIAEVNNQIKVSPDYYEG